MNFTNIAISILIFLASMNAVLVSRVGRDMHYVKCDLECTKKNVWYTQDLLLREKK